MLPSGQTGCASHCFSRELMCIISLQHRSGQTLRRTGDPDTPNQEPQSRVSAGLPGVTVGNLRNPGPVFCCSISGPDSANPLFCVISPAFSAFSSCAQKGTSVRHVASRRPERMFESRGIGSVRRADQDIQGNSVTTQIWVWERFVRILQHSGKPSAARRQPQGMILRRW